MNGCCAISLTESRGPRPGADAGGPAELEDHRPAAVPPGQRGGLGVPAAPAGQRPATRSGGVGIAELSLDAPVVWKIQGAPTRVGEGRVPSRRDIAQMESLAAVEGERRSLSLRRRRERGDEQREQATTTEPSHGCTVNR